ncbi:MAG: orotate phosphoribosyltransferase [Oligoflexia bacterium]|nr:orotate phosphoribosyltransferase [Oligoflexia bacterium]
MDSKTIRNANYQTLKARLVQIIKEKSYREGDFTLASGKKSKFYLDVKETSLDPEGAHLIGKMMVELIQQKKLPVRAVGGLTLGADPLATAVSMSGFDHGLSLPAYIVRKQPKEHGTSLWVEGAKSFQKGWDLIVLEDVVTTGGSSIKAVEKVREAGFKVESIITVVDRLEGGRECIEKEGVRLFSLCDLQEIQTGNLKAL